MLCMSITIEVRASNDETAGAYEDQVDSLPAEVETMLEVWRQVESIPDGIKVTVEVS